MKQQNQNLAVQNKWVCDIPLSTIDGGFEDVSLNLVSYSIPAIDISSGEFGYQGNTIEIPTGVINPTDKTITFNYLISSDWKNYKNLYRWVALLGTVNSPITAGATATTSTYSQFTLPIRVYILDEFKQTVLSVKYSNAWISQFSEISMDYSDEPNPINHSFTIKYSDFILE